MSKGIHRRVVGKIRRMISGEVSEIKRDEFHVDEPVDAVIRTTELIVSGWYLPAINSASVQGIRAVLNNRTIPLEYGTERQDVANSHPDRVGAINCGFYKRIPYEENGRLTIEVDKGNGYEIFFDMNIEQDLEVLADMSYNPALATRYSEHINLLESRKQYYYEEENKNTFSLGSSDPRLVALYLPQFHPIPENDKAWGRGFTEWTNVTSAVPRFIGHQQPILPKDLGFYDLRLDSTIEEQVSLARKYGLYGFCFYYYWFSGKKLLERPVESFIAHKEWDFNFMICWANENWTKRWDGKDDEVIVAQKYNKDDPINFIKDVEHIIIDPRYIRENGKPILMVYRPMHLKNPKKHTEVWREYIRKKHGLELHLVSVLSFDFINPKEIGFDASMDFAPMSLSNKGKEYEAVDYSGKKTKDALLDINFTGKVIDYRKTALDKTLMSYFDFETYKCVMPSWDNDARKKGGGRAEALTSPDLYGTWLDNVLKNEMTRTKNPLVFINAWNEWAEGTVMEPTQHLGHAILNRTAEVLAKYSNNQSNSKKFPLYNIRPRQKSTKLAVIVHAFYSEEWRQISEKLKNIGSNKYDLFVSVPIKKSDLKKEILDEYPKAQVFTVPNRGRDVLPFMIIARRVVELGYISILKLHTKRSPHLDGGRGEDWLGILLNSLLQSRQSVNNTLKALDGEPCIIGAKGTYVSVEKYIGSNKNTMKTILSNVYEEAEIEKIFSDIKNEGFFASTMFWTSSSAIKPLLDMYFLPDDFHAEKSQVDGTTAHALERLFTITVRKEGGILYELDKKGRLRQVVKPRQDFPFVP